MHTTRAGHGREPHDGARAAAALALAKRHWVAERAKLRVTHPAWPMPAWSRAPAWQRRPYLLAAVHGKHPDQAW